MKRILVATVLATFALGSAAMAQDASCETKAVGKDGTRFQPGDAVNLLAPL